jgi:predicted transcriptional regulator
MCSRFGRRGNRRAYNKGMAMRELDWNQPVPMTEEEDEETLAAIDRGVQSADEGRLVPIEEVRKRLARWNTKSTSLTTP